MNEPNPIDAEVVQSNQALAVRSQASPTLFRTDDPAEIVSRATIVASSLKEVIAKQGLISRISGKEYPRCEAWTLLGTMLGVFPVCIWTREVAGGWEARVEARTRDGSVVGAAEAQCLKSEKNWSNRDDFALRSMAQTRATAKCLRMPLGFVMTLAGYEPTPAEEMARDQHKPQDAPGRAEPAQKPATARQEPGKAIPKPTANSLRKMIAALKAGPGEPNRALVTEYFRKIENMAPKQELETLDLRFVPATERQMKDLAEKLAEFGNGSQAAAAFPPHWSADNSAAPKDDEAWRDVIVPIPPKGMKRDQYLKSPQTIGQLFDLRHGSDDESQAARQRLWGFVNHFEPKPWIGKDGQERPPSKTDVTFREALDQFVEYFTKHHPDEKL